MTYQKVHRRQARIEIEDITKIYNTERGKKIVVFENLNVEILENEFICLIGPSGCGKSTLLSIIAGLEQPTSGRILVDGKPIRGPGRDRGVIFQEDAVFLWRTVIKNVEYGLEVGGIEKREREKIARQCLELVGLEEFADLYPKELSGGMKKKVCVAMVYANDPKILLMDEPFGSLDYPTKCNLQIELLRMWKEKTKTTIFVTHDVEEALFLADRIFVLHNGRFASLFKNPFPRPRRDSLRVGKDFNEVKGQLKRYLQ